MEPNPPEETEAMQTPRRRQRRGGRDRHPHGRAWVLALWVVLRLGELPLAWLTLRAIDPVPDFGLSLIVSVLWTTALFVALWMRQVWALPVTAIFLGLFVCWWGYDTVEFAMYLARAHVWLKPERLGIPIATTLSYIAVIVALLRSKSIKYLTDPTAGWRTREV